MINDRGIKKFAAFKSLKGQYEILNEEIKKNSKILFEGAQGAMLCLDHGTYPYVTSSHPLSAGVCVGTGVGPMIISNRCRIAF